MEKSLLVTLRMDDSSFKFFDEVRQKYFPPHRNKIPAHITFFHALPGIHSESIKQTLKEHAENTRPFKMETSGIWLMNSGVAFLVESKEAVNIHGSLQRIWFDWLKPQDKNSKLKPHITVQNRVDPEEAKVLHKQLESEFQPMAIIAMGLELWRYVDGYWEFEDRYNFKQ